MKKPLTECDFTLTSNYLHANFNLKANLLSAVFLTRVRYGRLFTEKKIKQKFVVWYTLDTQNLNNNFQDCARNILPQTYSNPRRVKWMYFSLRLAA